MNAYQEDLAYIHDAGFGFAARNAAPVLLEALRERSLKRGRVIELGCGSGILSAAVSEAGYDVLGIDLSESMLAFAKKRAPKAEFRCESFLTATLPECVAVAAVGECFNYLFDEGNTKQAIRKLFGRIHDALCPGGLFLFDTATPGRVPGPGATRGHAEGDDWAVLYTAEEDRRQKILTRKITTFRKVGDLYRRTHEDHRLRLYTRAELATLLRRFGFRVRTLSRYGDWRFPPGYIGFLARKG